MAILTENKKSGRKPKPHLTIGIDCGSLSTPGASGINTLTANLLVQLGEIDTRNQYLLYSFAPIDKQLVERFNRRAKNVILSPPRFYQLLRLPLKMYQNKPDVYIALSQAMPFWAPPTLGFIYDTAFLKYGSMYKRNLKLRANTFQLAKRSAHIVTISEASKTDIENEYHIDPDKISVYYPGVAPTYKLRGIKYFDIKPYFLYVGHLKPTKNIPRLLESFSQLINRIGEKYRLVLIGSQEDIDPQIPTTIKRLKLAPYVLLKGQVPLSELPKYYRGAVALVTPALYEGFGLPIVEAMACGCPVIASTNSAMPEIVGNAGLLVDAANTQDISYAMEKIAEDTNTHRRLVKKSISQAKLYNWHEFARGVLDDIYSYCAVKIN